VLVLVLLLGAEGWPGVGGKLHPRSVRLSVEPWVPDPEEPVGDDR